MVDIIERLIWYRPSAADVRNREKMVVTLFVFKRFNRPATEDVFILVVQPGTK